MNTKLTLASAAAALLLGASTAASASCTSASNLIANCGFETGDFTGWVLAGTDTTTIQGLQYYGVEGFDPFPLAGGGTAPNSGNYQAFVSDPYNLLTMSQSFATTVGATYTVSFYMATATLDGDTTVLTNALTAKFGTSTLATLSAVADSSYTLYTYDVAATAASTTFSLAMTNLTGEFILDDFSVTKDVTAVPETSTPLLMGAGLLALGLAARRKRQ